RRRSSTGYGRAPMCRAMQVSPSAGRSGGTSSSPGSAATSTAPRHPHGSRRTTAGWSVRTTAKRVWRAARRPPRWLKGVVGATVLGATAVVAAAKPPSIGHTLHELGHPQPGLLALAIVAQILSLRAYSEMVGRLLARAGRPVGQWPLGRMTL